MTNDGLLNITSHFLDKAATEKPNNIAIYGGPAAITYEELRDKVNRAASVLLLFDCQPGDRILIALPDSSDFIVAFFGATKIGAVAVPVNPLATETELRFFCKNSGARIAIVHSEAATKLRAVTGKIECSVIEVRSEELRAGKGTTWTSLLEVASPTYETFPSRANDLAFILYTSGSTGQTKAVAHCHRSMVAASINFGQGILHIDSNDRTLSVSKLFFAYGLGNGMYFPFSVRAATILMPQRVNIASMSDLVRRYRPTLFFAVPTFYHALKDEMQQGLDIDLSSVRLFVSAGEPLSPDLFYEFRRMTGMEILDGLGSTEMLQTVLSNRPGRIRVGSCGQLVPNYDSRIVDERLVKVDKGSVGNLWLRGQSSFIKYWKDPQLSNLVLKDGWVNTGDLCYVDDDGYHFFVGRSDDSIKRGGMWVSPLAVETVLRSFQSVEAAAVVVDRTNDEAGRLVAYISPKKDSVIDLSLLRRHLISVLPGNMLPAHIVCLQDLPELPNGKIDRVRLGQITPLSTSADVATSEAPKTGVEHRLYKIFTDVFGRSDLDTDVTFLDLGGDSLLATKISNRILLELELEISFDTFFQADSTIAKLAIRLGEMIR
jgi:benzoate-CoA ligase family protein